MLSRDFSNHQEHCYAQLAKQEGWQVVRVSKNAKNAANGD